MSLRRSPYKGACLIGFLIAQFFEFGLTLGRDGVSDDRIAYYIVYSAVGLIVLVGLFAIGMMVYDYRR